MTLAIAGADAASLRSDDYQHLMAVLRLAGCGRRTRLVARALLDEGGSLGGVMTLSDGRLARMGVHASVIDNLSVLRSAHLTALRRMAFERPLINGLDSALNYLHAAMAHLSHEVFRVLFLDSRHQLIRDEVMGSGTANRCAIYPREVLVRAVDLAACHLVLVHNHPSGALEPSTDDIKMTERLVRAAEVIEVGIDDHLIIGRGGHFSFRSAGLITNR